MFCIGFSEVIIVFLAVIIFVRPDDLPKFLRTLGRLYGKAKKAYNELVAVKDRVIREIDGPPDA
jgi:Sec-independent protein translocase protein TatA